jgi:hypothetical protein
VPDKAKAGTLFIREGTIFPNPVHFETEPYLPGWSLVKNLDGHGLDREIGRAGWTFFCLAGDIQATVLGNSLKITEVVAKHFLGVPCTNVHARSRHIQESVFLFRT